MMQLVLASSLMISPRLLTKLHYNTTTRHILWVTSPLSSQNKLRNLTHSLELSAKWLNRSAVDDQITKTYIQPRMGRKQLPSRWSNYMQFEPPGVSRLCMTSTRCRWAGHDQMHGNDMYVLSMRRRPLNATGMRQTIANREH